MDNEIRHLVYGAHAGGKSSFVKTLTDARTIGCVTLDIASMDAWERLRLPGTYEVLPVVPGAMSYLAATNKTANVKDLRNGKVDFRALVSPPYKIECTQVAPPFLKHLDQYYNRDAKLFGISKEEAANILKRLRSYYDVLTDHLVNRGYLVRYLSM